MTRTESREEMGATAVYVSGAKDEKARIVREGAPFADALVVRLPKDKDARSALFKVAETEAEEQGLESEADLEEIFLWWD